MRRKREKGEAPVVAVAAEEQEEEEEEQTAEDIRLSKPPMPAEATALDDAEEAQEEKEEAQVPGVVMPQAGLRINQRCRSLALNFIPVVLK